MSRLNASSAMATAVRLVYVLLVATNCWLLMQGVHESGHVVAAFATGGRVKCVVWHPFAISRTDLSVNPHPLFVCWAGPIVGALLPISGLLFPSPRSTVGHLIRFFSGFCLIANGAYIAIGSIDHIGDAGTLLRLGAAPATLWVAGCAAMIVGFCLWHSMGRVSQLFRMSVTGWQLASQIIILLVIVMLQWGLTACC